MKNVKTIFLFLLIHLLAGSSTVRAQQKSPDEIKKTVESQNYIFKAETAYPQVGGSRQLSPGYDLTITTNSIIAYLPYFGRAYTAPIITTDGGIKFTSTDFEYKATKNKKGWEITMKPKDAGDVLQLNLVVYENGNAKLDVLNLNRQGISFSGYIK